MENTIKVFQLEFSDACISACTDHTADSSEMVVIAERLMTSGSLSVSNFMAPSSSVDVSLHTPIEGIL